jgi:hypothetical protein
LNHTGAGQIIVARNPVHFVGFGAMDVTKPYSMAWGHLWPQSKPSECIGLRATIDDFAHTGIRGDSLRGWARGWGRNVQR